MNATNPFNCLCFSVSSVFFAVKLPRLGSILAGPEKTLKPFLTRRVLMKRAPIPTPSRPMSSHNSNQPANPIPTLGGPEYARPRAHSGLAVRMNGKLYQNLTKTLPFFQKIGEAPAELDQSSSKPGHRAGNQCSAVPLWPRMNKATSSVCSPPSRAAMNAPDSGKNFPRAFCPWAGIF